MSHGNQSFLRFSLEESVWFQRGQEVEDLISISLDPNITIQENDQYVTIRGTLDLTGEYRRHNESVDEDSQDRFVQKWVNSVEVREEGLCEFSHQFPVDITIPTYRVRDTSEIDVIIETFDYQLPERSCLKLTADLNVTGLYEEQTVVREEEAEEEKEEVFELSYRFQEKTQEQTEDETQAEAREEVRAEVEEASVEESNASDYEAFEVEARKEDTFFTEPTLVESSSHQPSTPEISFSAYRSEEPAPNQNDAAEDLQPVYEDETNLGDELANHHQEESSSSSPSIVEQVKKKLTSKKSMSISEFLARKEGEDHAKLKVCIVQHGESASLLAERYDVPVAQLLKVNKLEPNQDVYEGQVLYVPNVAAKN